MPRGKVNCGRRQEVVAAALYRKPSSRTTNLQRGDWLLLKTMSAAAAVPLFYCQLVSDAGIVAYRGYGIPSSVTPNILLRVNSRRCNNPGFCVLLTLAYKNLGCLGQLPE